MRLSIRSIMLLTILVPMLLPSLALSVWHTTLRVRDARAGLIARGEHDVRYLADAGSLALMVGDVETLRRLAASNLSEGDTVAARLFLDADGRLLAAAGNAREVARLQRCAGSGGCRDEASRYVFTRTVQFGSGSSASNTELGGPTVVSPQPVGTVLLSLDPRRLGVIQRAMLRDGALITFGALLVAWLATARFSRRLTIPMQHLSTVVARIQNGELGTRTVPSGSGELRELEQGINAMADRVEASSLELNRRVDEATIELSLTLIEREQRNRALDIALERAESAARAKDLFLARMSHELRTPLATVTGYARLMQQSRSEAQRADFYRTLEQASQILVATVDDILTFVKLEEGSLRFEQREFDLEACIEDVVRMQAPAAHAKRLDIVCHVVTGLPCCVIGDSLRLSQVLTNLISNAIKFTPVGSVTVQAGIEDDAMLRVVVVDTGIGIASEAVPQLFRPFVQGDESVTRRFGGSGLGLSIAASLVRALGGQIDLQSHPGEGTRVTVRLPLALPGCGAAAAVPLPRLRVALASSPGNPHLVALRDYLGDCFELREFVDARALSVVVAGTDAWVPDLCLLLGESQTEACEDVLPASVSLVQLQRIEAVADVDAARSRHCHNVVSLPLRRRELLAACLQGSGNAGRVVVSRCGEFSDDGERALASHCLVVEDNALNLRMIATQLRTLGVRVSEARSGAAALELLERQHPDVMLADVHMPGMDGVALAGCVRDRFPALPVYALTANVIGSEEHALAEAGVRAVLYKPLDIARLLDVLACHARADRGWRVVSRAGIADAEVVQEIARLFDATCSAAEAGERSVAVDIAHQLLGVARMFTEGELAGCCLDLERALRAPDDDPVRQEIENLAILVRKTGPY
ncbi:MAG: response regulator [Pseudomonadales bacterium]|jgi:two-component system sensor histidine kinase BarA|nr:response regulator [Pseudomonadales bacterium]MCP5320555.1 response regulator [Pseudomonadales bacterium]MCP5336700.1 response regulator [Pseudomonadales bacterium]